MEMIHYKVSQIEVCRFARLRRWDLDCVHTMPAHFEDGENVMDRPPVHTKTAHFLPADFENGRFWKQNSNEHIFETASCEQSKMMKTEHLSTLLERDWSILRLQVHLFGIKILQRVFYRQNSYRSQIVPVSCARWIKFCYRHIFHCFQNVAASCERSLSVSSFKMFLDS